MTARSTRPSPVRVLYEIHPQTLGGTERFLARFLPRLAPHRFEPLVISQARGAPLRLIESAGIRTIVLGDYFAQRGVGRIAKVIEKNGVALVQSNYYGSTLAMAASLAGVPHVWRLGGHVRYGSGAGTPAKRQLALEMIRLLSKSIVCNSQYVRRQFGRSRDADSIRVIPNGIDLPRARSGKGGSGGSRVGMIAHFTEQKRHCDFIRAAELVSADLPETSFTILGSECSGEASRRHARHVRHRARGLRRSGRLQFGEYHDDGDVADVLRGLDMLVLPSVGESFSNAVLEAMAAGIPVIAARSGGNPELIVHGKSGLLVPPEQPEALARAMKTLLRRPERMRELGAAARERTRLVFSLTECVRHYQTEYDRVLREPSGGMS